MEQTSSRSSGFGLPWFVLTVAFALHVLDEATTGFLPVYNASVLAMRARWGWFPMPTFEFRVWLAGLIFGVVLCFALTPVAALGARWLRPLAWLYAVIHFFNAMGHTVATILGHTVASVTFPRPAPGFYSSPLLFIGSVWLMVRLWRTASGSPKGRVRKWAGLKFRPHPHFLRGRHPEQSRFSGGARDLPAGECLKGDLSARL